MSACFCRHRRRRLGRSVNWQLNSALCPVPAAVTPQLHHLATALCAPKRPGAAPEEQKGCRTSWWWRREGWAGHALGQASREEAGTAGHTGSSLYHWGPQWYPSQGCPALLLMICSAGKKIYKCFAGHIPLLFMSAPLNTHLLQSSLQHCVFGTSSYSYISKFTSLLWLAGARDISSPQWCSWEDVCSGGMQKSSSKFFVFWQTLLKDFALTWARHGTGRCCASFPRSTGSASWIWPATTAPPWAPFPLPSQPRPAFILSRESSPCQIAWWFSDVNRWD